MPCVRVRGPAIVDLVLWIPMPADDRVWLRLDRPENVLSVVSATWTATPVDPGRLRALITGRMLRRYPVLRCRPVLPPWPLPAVWEEDPHFDLDRHLHVDRRADAAEHDLQRFVGDLRSAEFDRRHPLWRVHLLPHGSGSAVVLQVHHSITDGIRLTRLMVELLDPAHPGDAAALTPPATHMSGAPSPAALLDPRRAVGAAGELARTALHSVGSLVKLLAWSNPCTAWTGSPGPAKHAAWGDPVPLAALADLAHRHGATVNDVLLALVGGAVRRVLDARGGAPADLAWMVPVNLEPYDPAPPAALGNHFSLVLAVLPTYGPFAARLAEVHARNDRIRHSWEPWLTAATQRLVGSTPAAVGVPVARFFADKAVGVLTTVPGPPVPMTLAGAPVTGSVGWAPCSGDQGLTVCMFSYAGQVFTGFGTDGRLVGDAGRLVRAFGAEVAEALGTSAPVPAAAP
ncbi:WS/DGAT domain-containing protein [Pseudonocardia sp. RS010]|uniref:WS/DGAT domain-containing protein n=1 Tax=Pseudonocardia sp. RS010 TaxID=3385979 RepID=UPI00399FE040